MYDVKIEDILSKILFLERRFNVSDGIKLLEPFALDAKNIISVQNAAKVIANFVGLGNLIFVISYCHQNEGTAGNINLNDSKEVFIEISNDLIETPNSILAVLAHEISHKFLYIHNIKPPEGKLWEIENEILTDITSFYIGLGKLILNGCESTANTFIQKDNGVSSGVRYSKIGYLSIDKYAFIYNVICFIRKIPINLKYKNLTDIVSEKIKENYIKHKKDFLVDKFYSDSEIKGLINTHNKSIFEIHRKLNSLNNLLFLFEKYILQYYKNYLIDSHQELNDNILNIKNLFLEEENNLSVKYLNAIVLNIYNKNKIPTLDIKGDEIEKFIDKLERIVCKDKDITEISNKIYNDTITCYNCGFIKKTDKGIENRLKCPNCNYEFFVSNKINLSKSKIRNIISGLKKQI